MCESRREELEFLYFCDSQQVESGFLCEPRDHCVNPEGKCSNSFFCDRGDICVNPKESSSVFCVSPWISV